MTDEKHALAETAGNATAAGKNASTEEKKQVRFKPEPPADQKAVDGERSGGEDAYDDAGVSVGVGPAVKKKKKRKSKMGRGLGKPTGFEEYYVDAPVTPLEHQEELAIYSIEKPFLSRIETAIQRYIVRRKFDAMQKDVFDKYMAYGGVTAGPKMFGGGLETNNPDQTAAEIADQVARHWIKDGAPAHSVVDFDGVLRAFLSYEMPNAFILDTEAKLKKLVHVIRNFLNYLLHHDVCPEYKDQIDAAKRTCDLAELQLWSIREAVRIIPGQFNKACSVLFGGQYMHFLADDEKGFVSEYEMTREDATMTFNAGMAAYADMELIGAYNNAVKSGVPLLARTIRSFLEVTEIRFSDRKAREAYEDPLIKGYQIVGKLIAKTWHCPADCPEDLTEEEEAELVKNGRPVETYEFWVEDKLLEKFFVGLKFEADIRELTFGLKFFDTAFNFLPAFYNHIPNDLMTQWREHKFVPRRDEPAADKGGGAEDPKLLDAGEDTRTNGEDGSTAGMKQAPDELEADADAELDE